MSIRIMSDGKPADLSSSSVPRKPHAIIPGIPWFKCQICGSDWGWVNDRRTAQPYRRHLPGTFWERR